MVNRYVGVAIGISCVLIPLTLIAQVQPDAVPLRNWPAPLYWQPSTAERRTVEARLSTSAEARLISADDITPKATTPAGALVFVAMTPCRVVDTRMGQGFTGAFGPPSLVGGGSRTFPIQSSTTCSTPPIAQAYSFNVTVVPQGATFPGNVNPSGALGFLTIWPTGVAQPNASTLNSWLGTVAANAAIVPAGMNGSVDVFVSNNTDLIIDINGYYAPQSGITLAQGTATAPSMSFSGDSKTGIFSSGTGTLNIATAGTNRLTVASDGSVSAGGMLTGNIVNASTEYWIAGNQRVLSTPGTGFGNFAAGPGAGSSLGNGSNNAIFGTEAGFEILNGSSNSFFGTSAGVDMDGNRNSIFGASAGSALISGADNAFFGAGIASAGSISRSYTGNTLIGASVDSTSGLTNAGAIGFRAMVTASNSLILGSVNGSNGATSDTDVGIGLTAPNTRLDVVDTTSASQIHFGDTSADNGGFLTSTQPSQAIMSGGAKYNGSTWVAKSTGAALIDANAGDILFFTDSGLTNGATYTPTSRVVIASNGVVTLNNLGTTGGSALCRNASNQIAACNASSIRYKTNIDSYNSGMNLVQQLHPVSFNWKEDGTADFGLVAEDVANVEPLLVIHNSNGEVEGVKYDRLNVLIINAVKQQQAQIEDQQTRMVEQQKTIEQQQIHIDQLTKLVCSEHPQAEVCR